VNPLNLHSEIDTEDEIEQIFHHNSVDVNRYDIHDYSFEQLVSSTQGYDAKVYRVEGSGYDTVNMVDSDAERFLNWVAREEEVIDITEATVEAEMDKYSIDLNRAVLSDGIHPDEPVEVDHKVYDELPQYFTVFSLIDDDQEEAEFYYKTVNPEKMLKEQESDTETGFNSGL